MLEHTDKDTLVAMLQRAGITFQEDVRDTDASSCVTVIGGYAGFYTDFMFRPDGSLHSVKAYE